jgi:hypothetical protein
MADVIVQPTPAEGGDVVVGVLYTHTAVAVVSAEPSLVALATTAPAQTGTDDWVDVLVPAVADLPRGPLPWSWHPETAVYALAGCTYAVVRVPRPAVELQAELAGVL